MSIKDMMKTHPGKSPFDDDLVLSMLETVSACAQTCTACADACLGEEEVQSLVKCIRLNLDCADICTTTTRLFSRRTEGDPATLRSQLEACSAVCRACGEECDYHASHHVHCRICAESCRNAQSAVEALISDIRGR